MVITGNRKIIEFYNAIMQVRHNKILRKSSDGIKRANIFY